MIRKHTRGRNSGLYIWSAIRDVGKQNVSEYLIRNHKSFCCVIKRKYRHTCCTLPECSKSLFPVYFSGSVNNSWVSCLPCSCYNLWKSNKCVSFTLKVKFKILIFSNCSWSRFNFKFTLYFHHIQQVFISCYQSKGNCNFQAILLWIQTLWTIFQMQCLSGIKQTAFVQTVHSMWIHNTYYNMKLSVSC